MTTAKNFKDTYQQYRLQYILRFYLIATQRVVCYWVMRMRRPLVAPCGGRAGSFVSTELHCFFSF